MHYILVYGAPATGKTTLAQTLAETLGLPLIRKDQIKELLFDTLGYGTRELSERYGQAARSLLYDILARNVRAGVPAVYEATFNPAEDAAALAQLFSSHTATGIEVFCTAPPAVIGVRFENRQRSGRRHPGHHLIPSGEALFPYLAKFEPLRLTPHLFLHETATFAQSRALVEAVTQLWNDSQHAQNRTAQPAVRA